MFSCFLATPYVQYVNYLFNRTEKEITSNYRYNWTICDNILVFMQKSQWPITWEPKYQVATRTPLDASRVFGVCSPPLSKSWLHPWFTVWMFFVAHFSILFSSNANNFFLNNFFRIIFIMPAVCPRSLRRNLATSTTNHSARFYRK